MGGRYAAERVCTMTCDDFFVISDPVQGRFWFSLEEQPEAVIALERGLLETSRWLLSDHLPRRDRKCVSPRR
jgi:hypothetical protein